MAVSGFKGFGWLLGIATVSPACYMVSSQVASERGRVEAVDHAILYAKRDIRTLETEFQTRANLAQLERWNGDVLALSAPRPDQYLTGDSALASLRPLQDGRQYAALVVPAATDVAQAVVAPIVQPAVVITMPAKPLESPAAIETARATVHKAVVTTVAKTHIQAVAMVDTKLLSDATFGDLMSSARSERGSPQ